ncbi:hypothetical protein JGU66_13075 [Myxococcaceae bacterium JPH2]|nr:hypothetical protein [Myxococcaceae bacterium JPH2]
MNRSTLISIKLGLIGFVVLAKVCSRQEQQAQQAQIEQVREVEQARLIARGAVTEDEVEAAEMGRPMTPMEKSLLKRNPTFYDSRERHPKRQGSCEEGQRALGGSCWKEVVPLKRTVTPNDFTELDCGEQNIRYGNRCYTRIGNEPQDP